MISEQQKEVRKSLIKLRDEIVKVTGGNMLYKPITMKLDGLIKDMETKEFPQDKLNSTQAVFGNIAASLGVK
jgi:hypothetical protein